MGLFNRKTAGGRSVERRRFPRISDSLAINYQVSSEPPRLGCCCKDISEGGIRFGLYQELQPGASIKLRLQLRGCAEPAWIFGKIAWIKETLGKEHLHEAGVEFEGLDPGLRSKLHNHIQGSAS